MLNRNKELKDESHFIISSLEGESFFVEAKRYSPLLHLIRTRVHFITNEFDVNYKFKLLVNENIGISIRVMNDYIRDLVKIGALKKLSNNYYVLHPDLGFKGRRELRIKVFSVHGFNSVNSLLRNNRLLQKKYKDSIEKYSINKKKLR